MSAFPVKKISSLAKEAQKIRAQVNDLILKMQKQEHFTPTRDQLEECAETMLSFIDHHHAKIAPYTSHLKSAIIDLTEVPMMSPQMQRISYLTSLKDAEKHIDLFISCL